MARNSVAVLAAMAASGVGLLASTLVVGCAPGLNTPPTAETKASASESGSADSGATGELGTSIVEGRVADLSGESVVDVFVTISDDYCVPDRTSASGAFAVEMVRDGTKRLITYGETASNGTFASLVFPILVEGDTTLADAVLVPRLVERYPIDLESAAVQTIASSDGLELDVEPGALTLAPFFDSEILVARVPVANAPAFVPEGVELRDLFVLHPIRSTFDPPAPLRLPASPELSPGAAVTFYSLDYDTGLLTPVAEGTVNDEGAPVTNPGQGIPELTWVGVAITD